RQFRECHDERRGVLATVGTGRGRVEEVQYHCDLGARPSNLGVALVEHRGTEPAGEPPHAVALRLATPSERLRRDAGTIVEPATERAYVDGSPSATTDQVAPASWLMQSPTAAAAIATPGRLGWARTSWTSWSTGSVGDHDVPRSVERWMPPTWTFARTTPSSDVAAIDRTLSASPTWCPSSRFE